MSESLACRKKWTFTSTGVGEGYQTNGIARSYTWYVETIGSSRSTCNFQIQTARSTEGSTIAGYVSLTYPYSTSPSTFALTSATLAVFQFDGPFLAVRPYVTDMGSTGAAGSTGVHVTVTLVGN